MSKEHPKLTDMSSAQLRERVVDLSVELCAIKERVSKYENLLRIAANNAHDSGEEDSFEDEINAALP